ncbi:MAG: T9SS type A sorting domain-containing protein [Prevotella sp.]|nr:T9SS type A sorting domain-containing protein [Prevotella sp.]
MKKQFVFLLLLFMATAASAQLKVNSNGKVFIQKPDTVNNAILNIGSIPNSPFTYEDEEDMEMGIHVQNYDTGQNYYFTGILSETSKQSTSGYSIGVWGFGMGAETYKNIGVLGTFRPDETGVGVMGTGEGGPAPPITGSYAGYFYGDTYVDGNLTTYGLYNLSDMRLKSDVTSLGTTRDRKESPLTKLAGLDVFTYHLQHPNRDSLKTDKNRRQRDWQAKDAQRLHYGVSAQELQKIFPDLVREGQDGYLTVNYTEMVPLLLHCIKELKQEVETLKNESGDNASSRTSFVDDETTGIAPVATSSKGVCLFQNTPNPFSERTLIRFTLPENVQNAYIYIFDMQGKMQKQIPVDASMQSITINGYELSAGMYIYSLVVNGKEVDTKRMILSK